MTLEQLLPKIDKSEILRHYRIGNYNNTTEMLNLIALKKGLVDKQVVDGTTTNGKKSKQEKKLVSNIEQAARRFLRDFLNGRI